MTNIKDYATSLIVSPPIPANTGTFLTVSSGHGARFPEAPFYATVHPALYMPDLDNAEKVLVTEVNGDKLTIKRGLGDTSAKYIVAGWRISNTFFTHDIAEPEKGEKGDKGDQGIQGEEGPTGPTGPQGEDGAQGIQGDIGPKGDTGSTGPQGMQGERGLKGDKGDKGETGEDSTVVGPTGPSIVAAEFLNDDIIFTKDDTTTVTLEDAKSELKGDQGIQGEAGPTGATGPQGLQGITGDTGDSGLVVDSSTPASTDVVWLDTDDTSAGLTKADIGLGNVDNTSDMNKPVSTAQAAADATKVSKSGDTMTGRIGNATNNLSISNTRGGKEILFGATSIGNFGVLNNTDSIETFNVMSDGSGIRLGTSIGLGILKGTGFPNGVVSAPVGSKYIDTANTNGALEWMKTSGTGNTGWVVSVGDTGMRRLDIALISSGYIYYRRICQDVSVAIGGGTFDSIQYATDAPINTRRRIVAVGDVPVGFRFPRAQTALLTTNSEFIAGTVYHSGAGDANYIELRNSGRAIVTSEYIRPASVTFQTNESWPTSLPGTAS